MKQLNKKEEEQLKQAFDAICNMFYATEKDNFSKCAAFHIKPFNTHWDKKTVKELMYGLKLYIGSWVIHPMEEALKMNRIDVKKEEQKRSREANKRKKEWLESSCILKEIKAEEYQEQCVMMKYLVHYGNKLSIGLTKNIT